MRHSQQSWLRSCSYLSNLEDLQDLLSKSGRTSGFGCPAVGTAQAHTFLNRVPLLVSLLSCSLPHLPCDLATGFSEITDSRIAVDKDAGQSSVGRGPGTGRRA